jgi:acetyltransferase-like isoleucine patch superfamily enzyme
MNLAMRPDKMPSMTRPTDYRPLFKSCGQNVQIAPDAYFEHPERVEVGDNVKIMGAFHMGLGQPQTARIGSNALFYPNCVLQGGGHLILEENVTFFPNTYIALGGEKGCVEIGHHTHFAPNCVLYGQGRLKIGPYCNIAAHCVLATAAHDPLDHGKPMCQAPNRNGPITLVEDVWLGANVTITGNVTIARGCVVGANAVVTRDTEPMGLYAGVPARRLRDRIKAE